MFNGGIVSTINDIFDFEIPSTFFKNNYKTVDITINNTVVSTLNVPLWNSSVPTAIFIPSGTMVSSIISAGTIITSSYYEDNQIPIMGLCAEFINDYNSQFWKRDLSDEWNVNSSFIMDEIKYYENFFEELKLADSNEKKFQVYEEQIYPLLSATWTTFAASGYLDNPVLSSLQVEYSGAYPGKDIIKNHANRTFPTIAPAPFIHNLIEEARIFTRNFFIFS